MTYYKFEVPDKYSSSCYYYIYTCTVMTFIEMSTLKDRYQQSYGDLIIKLQVKDPIFSARLYSAGLFPGNTRAEVQSKATSAEAAMHFLDNVINRGWSNDNSNTQFEQLLTIMANCDDAVVKTLAADIKKGNIHSI